LQLRFDEFTFRLKPEQHEMELADTVRVEVAVEYKTRAWQTIEVDLGPGEATETQLIKELLAVCVRLKHIGGCSGSNNSPFNRPTPSLLVLSRNDAASKTMRQIC
jgi:hypothetical protein